MKVYYTKDLSGEKCLWAGGEKPRLKPCGMFWRSGNLNIITSVESKITEIVGSKDYCKEGEIVTLEITTKVVG